MTPEQKAERRQRELDRIFEAGRQNAAKFRPLTEEQVDRIVFILAPHVAAPRRRTTAALPQAA